MTVPLESVSSITGDANSRSDVAVTPDLSTVEGLQTPVVSNAGVRRLSKPKAKRAKLETVVSEDSSCVSDSTADVTDDKKENKRDKDFVLDTPSRRSTGFCFGNGSFVCQKSQVQHLIDQITLNVTLKNVKDC